MSEPQHSPPESFSQATSLQPTRRPGRSIMISETLKFEVYSDDSEDEDQIRKRLGLDNRYPIGPSGRPVAGSKRVAKSRGKATVDSMETEQNKPAPDGNSESQIKVPWGVKPLESFSFGTLTGNGSEDMDMKDVTMSDK